MKWLPINEIWFAICTRPSSVDSGCLFSLGWSISSPCFASLSLKSGQVHLWDLSLFLLSKIVGTIGFPYSWHLTLSLLCLPDSECRFPLWKGLSEGWASQTSSLQHLSFCRAEMHGAENREFWLPILSLNLCSLGSYFFLWYHSFSCRSGIAVFPGGHQIWFMNLCESISVMTLTQSPLREVCRGIWARPRRLIGSTILWGSQTCPPASHVAVTCNEKCCKWPTGCTGLLCCAGLYVEALTKVRLQGASQARASWGPGTSRAVARACYSARGMVPFKIWMLFTASEVRQQLRFLPTTAQEQNHNSVSKQQGSKQLVCPDKKGWKGNAQQLFQTLLWDLGHGQKLFLKQPYSSEELRGIRLSSKFLCAVEYHHASDQMAPSFHCLPAELLLHNLHISSGWHATLVSGPQPWNKILFILLLESLLGGRLFCMALPFSQFILLHDKSGNLALSDFFFLCVH